MTGTVIDTHALVWYLFEPWKLGRAALQLLDEAEFSTQAISAITLGEIEYLREKGRIPDQYTFRIRELANEVDQRVLLYSVDSLVARSVADIPRSVVPDMPDRIIAATALCLGLPLVTRDRQIRTLKNLETVW